MAQANGPVRVLWEASQSHSIPPLLKTPLRKAECMTCQGARMGWAPGSALQCRPKPKKKVSLLEKRIPFRQHPLTPDLRSWLSCSGAGAAALP
eukprot:10924768-Heterocapsa_arctica.AAC.1